MIGDGSGDHAVGRCADAASALDVGAFDGATGYSNERDSAEDLALSAFWTRST